MRCVGDGDVTYVHDYEGLEQIGLDRINNEFDLVHFGWYGMFPREWRSQCLIDIPVTVNVWGLHFGNFEYIAAALTLIDPIRIVVDDVMTLQQLGQLGFCNVTYIPLTFNYPPNPLPLPKGPFTVGVFGNSYKLTGGSENEQSKRYEVVEEGCRIAGVDYYPVIMLPSRHQFNLLPEVDVYGKVDVMAHASFVNTNSMPIREGLMHGRPALATRSDGLQRIIRHGKNGLFFDGSPEDLAEKIHEMKENYAHFRQGAIETRFEMTTQEAQVAYRNMWEDSVDIHRKSSL